MRHRDLFVVTCACLLFAVAIGVETGRANHAIYLLPGLHLADPSFLAADWTVTRTTVTHGAFTAIVAAMARSGHLELWLALGTIAQSVGLCLALWLVARHLYEDALVPWALTVAMLAATHTRGIGLSWLIMPQFEAASIAGVATVAGFGLLATDRSRLLAGLAFGVAALFHANYAILLVPVVGASAAWIALRRPGTALLLFAPLVVLGAPNYLEVLQQLADPMTAESSRLSLRRFPHHFDPRTWGPRQGLLFAASLVAAGVGLRVRPPRRRAAALVAIGTTTAIVCVGLAAGYAGLSAMVMRVMPWRLASLLIALAILAVAAAVFRPPAWAARHHIAIRAAFALAGAGAVAGLVFGPEQLRRVGAVTLAFVFFAARSGWLRSGTRAAPTPAEGRLSLLGAAVLALAFVPSVIEGAGRSTFTIAPEAPWRVELYDWIAANTPADAVFAAPTSWSDFRLNTGRGVVADHSPPLGPSEKVEWLERIDLMTDGLPESEAAPMDSAFFSLACERLATIERRFEARYAIRRSTDDACGHVLYSDGSYDVVDIDVAAGADDDEPR